MIVREFSPSDIPALQEIHRQTGFEYELPDFSSSEFTVRRILCDGDGLAMAAFLRKTTEAFLLCDAKWRSPRWRHEALGVLHEAVRVDAKGKGIGDVQALLPPEIEKHFGKRLLQLGWRRNLWTCYSRGTD